MGQGLRGRVMSAFGVGAGEGEAGDSEDERVTACAAWLAVHLSDTGIWFTSLREAVIGIRQMVEDPEPWRSVVTVAELNCRTAPDLNGEIITVWEAGEELSVWGSCDDDEGREWLMVTGGDHGGGWVSASYVIDELSA